MTDNKNKNTNPNEKTPLQRAMKPLVLVSQFGYNMLAPISVGIAGGYFMDKWLGTQPWGLIFLTVMGIGAAYKNAFTTFGRYMDKGKKEESEDDEK